MTLFSFRVRTALRSAPVLCAAICAVVVLTSAAGAIPLPIKDRYVPGQLMVELTPSCGALVPPHVNGLVKSLGAADLDQLNAKWGVKKIWKIVRHPHPNIALVKHGLTELYLLVADSSIDVLGMMAAYEQSPNVIYACPNIMRPEDESSRDQALTGSVAQEFTSLKTKGPTGGTDDVPNDPRYVGQWHLAKIHGAGAWDISHGDTTVKIAVIDDGPDFTHPDIARNLWINAAEDLNHNGKFDTLWYPDGDLDGIDDDGNGYADDVCGFDMVDHDPIPMPHSPDDHGCHCWGITNAVTNNDTGVASIGWGCRGMAFRCGGGGFIQIAAAIEALSYAINMGAWVSSHSYGSSSPYPPEQSVMQAAVDAGMIVCAAAGNDGNQNPHYPAYYDCCVAVAASDEGDHRASFSDYGDWVEVASPGTNILSTVPNSGYITMSGTSMATPLVAGLCALIKASDLGIDNQTCLNRMYMACDTMPDADYRNGLMGHGRINAMKSLAISRSSYLTVTSTHLNDPNHDGIAEPGEVCGISATLTNMVNWQNATSVAATLSSPDVDVTITKPHASFPDCPAGDTVSCAADSFVFSVNSNAVPHWVNFQITKTAVPTDLGPSAVVRVQVGTPRILLVNDYATDTIAKWYRWSCDSVLALYDQYVTAVSGAPSAETLRHYPVVIWFTGRDSTQSLSSACQTAITSYLDNGGKLFISGQNIGQNIGATSFYGNYLKAQFNMASTGKIFNLGIPGDPICEDDTIVCGGAGGAANALSVDGIKPIGGAIGSSIFKDLADTTIYGSVHYAGTYKLVYFSMPFEAIDHATQRYVQKPVILRRIMSFFGEPLPNAISEESGISSIHFGNVMAMPNPVSRMASIDYGLSRRLPVNVRVYDIRGRLVRVLVSGTQDQGWHHTTWDLRDGSGRAVAGGVYFCSVVAGAESHGTKLLVAR